MWVGAVYDCVMMEFTWVARSLAFCDCDCDRGTLYSLYSAQECTIVERTKAGPIMNLR